MGSKSGRSLIHLLTSEPCLDWDPFFARFGGFSCLLPCVFLPFLVRVWQMYFDSYSLRWLELLCVGGLI